MNKVLHITLPTDPVQRQRLGMLQQVFAQACNTLAPVVRDHRCWNRVALHHLAYKDLRERFPALGSQMACNAIYSVCRAARLVYQHPRSPFNLNTLGERPLPLLRFMGRSPVYFDRHTLSVRDEGLSMYTMEGRIRFQVPLGEDDVRDLRSLKLREVALFNAGPDTYRLSFWLQSRDGLAEDQAPDGHHPDLPEYVLVEDPA